MSTFNKFKARYIFVDFWLLSNIIVVIYLSFSGSFEEMSQPFSFTGNIIHIILFSSVCGSIVYRLRFCGVEVKQVIGSLNLKKIPWILLLIVFYGEYTLTNGIQYLEYYFVNLIFPEFVQSSINALKEGSNYSSSGLTSQIIQYLLLMIVLVVVAPITEEFIFRGVLMHRWAVKWGAFWSVILSSLLFGAVHLDAFWFSRAVGSIFIALFYIQTKNLLVPIILHALNNGLAFVDLLFNNLNVNTAQIINITHQYLWHGLVNILLAIPILIYFIKLPKTTADLPYFANSKKAELRNS